YEEMENAFVAESVHPMDLKNSAAKYINDILDPVRKVLL
ncbi:MAG TPA: tyrosine--tRNA ligase, partial [Methanosarcina vacuolata]|nr:tyrosine--tRNA ligase [Methanosarcina vacuolata]